MKLGPRASLNVSLLARLQKEYLHTPIWLEATCRSQTQNYGCDSDSILLVSGMPFSGDRAIPAA